MVSGRLAAVIVVLCVLIGCGPRYAECPPPVDGTFHSPNGAGTLIVENGVRRLKLHGSNYAMGYAYGYLLAGEIIYVMDNLILPLVPDYRELRGQMESVDWDKSYGNELAGMLAGIRDRLGPKDRMIHPHRRGQGHRSRRPQDSKLHIRLGLFIIFNLGRRPGGHDHALCAQSRLQRRAR